MRAVQPRTTRVLAALAVFGLVILLPAAAGAQRARPTIAVTGADLNAGTIEVTNHGDANVDINGLILCNFPAYAPISGVPVIGPGETIEVDSTALGVALDPTSGEMGIYTAAGYEDPDTMVTYVEWGDAGHKRAPVAIEAGVWANGVAEITNGIIRASSDNPTSPADWAANAEASELARTGANLTVTLLVLAGFLLLAGFAIVRSQVKSPC
ncbi:MAG: hypothetical protein ACI91O_001427 [Candidatus Poriferisodalaceae bacterium]|jgi:hypothetical protein